ncbi:MAG: ATP phosphoribosyltransferase regulatory subunit [Eubacterium sp.]|nr:ATP phosphoribosyltransferase regulatory subunit [Eubacterium sp.]
MNKVLLHTPEGVRDIYGKECSVKLNLEQKINEVFNRYGFHNIQTPTFEFFDIFSAERGSVPSKDLYKFFDREGNTLVLRPDMTPSIARLVAKYYMDVNLPVKLCYNANTYINNSELQGKLKEITQLGCEQINDDSVEADAEMIALVSESLKAVGLEEYLIEIGHADFYGGLLQECGLDEETEKELRIRIENKNNFGVEELLDEHGVRGEVKEALLKLPSLFGSVDVLETAKQLTTNKTAQKAIERLETLYSILEDYGVSKYISFDLGMVSNYEYYTGIIFKGYTYGLGNHIVAGGRYDQLLGQFGKNAPAIGFAVYMDQIMIALSGDSKKANQEYGYQVLVYEPEFRKYALQLATEYRKDGIDTELISKKAEIPIEEYVTFKKEDGAKGITYVSKNGATEY